MDNTGCDGSTKEVPLSVPMLTWMNFFQVPIDVSRIVFRNWESRILNRNDILACSSGLCPFIFVTEIIVRDSFDSCAEHYSGVIFHRILLEIPFS